MSYAVVPFIHYKKHMPPPYIQNIRLLVARDVNKMRWPGMDKNIACNRCLGSRTEHIKSEGFIVCEGLLNFLKTRLIDRGLEDL